MSGGLIIPTPRGWAQIASTALQTKFPHLRSRALAVEEILLPLFEKCADTARTTTKEKSE
jgi:hypothetical protein